MIVQGSAVHGTNGDVQEQAGKSMLLADDVKSKQKAAYGSSFAFSSEENASRENASRCSVVGGRTEISTASTLLHVRGGAEAGVENGQQKSWASRQSSDGGASLYTPESQGAKAGIRSNTKGSTGGHYATSSSLGGEDHDKSRLNSAATSLTWAGEDDDMDEARADVETILSEDVWDFTGDNAKLSKRARKSLFQGRYVVEKVIDRSPEFITLAVHDIHSKEPRWLKFYRPVPGPPDGNLNHFRFIREQYILEQLQPLECDGKDNGWLQGVLAVPRLLSFASPSFRPSYSLMVALNGHWLRDEMKKPMTVFRYAVVGYAILSALTDAWEKRQVLLGDVRPGTFFIIGDPPAEKNLRGRSIDGWRPCMKPHDVKVAIPSWRAANLQGMPPSLENVSALPEISRGSERVETRAWASFRERELLNQWTFQSNEAIAAELENKESTQSPEEDLYQVALTLAQIRDEQPKQDRAHFDAAARRWITAGMLRGNLLDELIKESRKIPERRLLDNAFKEVLSQRWTNAGDFLEAWHNVVPWKNLPEVFLKSTPLVPSIWPCEDNNPWSSAHYWKVVDMLESQKGEDIRQLKLPPNSFAKQVSPAQRCAIRDLATLCALRRITVMWLDINLSAEAVKIGGESLGNAVAVFASNLSRSLTVNGRIKSPVDFAHAISTPSTLTSLNLTDCALFDSGCKALAGVLKPSLNHLVLAKNGLTCLSASVLADKVAYTLRSLALTQNNIGANGALALALCVQGSEEKVSSMQALDMSSNCIGGALFYFGRAMATKGCVLRDFRAAENGLTSKDSRQFVEHIKDGLPSGIMFNLDLSLNCIGRGCEELLAFWQKKDLRGLLGLGENSVPRDAIEGLVKDVIVEKRPLGGTTIGFSCPWPPEFIVDQLEEEAWDEREAVMDKEELTMNEEELGHFKVRRGALKKKREKQAREKEAKRAENGKRKLVVWL